MSAVPSVMSSSTKDPMKSTSKLSSFNVETLTLNSKAFSSSTSRMKMSVKNKRLILEIGETSDMMKHKIEAKCEDSTIESPPDNSVIVSAKKVEESKNTSIKKGPPQWIPQVSISNPKENAMTLVLANEGTLKSQALKSEFLERCREEGFTINKTEGLTDDRPEK
jgi:hypothetical protein